MSHGSYTLIPVLKSLVELGQRLTQAARQGALEEINACLEEREALIEQVRAMKRVSEQGVEPLFERLYDTDREAEIALSEWKERIARRLHTVGRARTALRGTQSTRGPRGGLFQTRL